MSAEEYNSLLFEISQKLDELNVGRKLLVICRGKVAHRSEENMPDAFSLFEELEEKGFLGPDRLEVLKGMLKGVEEWSLLENVKKYESKRKEYNDLLEQIIRVLDELNDLERLIAMCREKIAEDRQGGIHDVRSLFKELENSNYLGVDRLGILKEILTQTEKSDLLKEVEEFEKKRNREDEFERRKAQAAAIVSSVSDNLNGVLNIKTVFKVVGGGIVVYSAYELLRRGSTYDQLITAINTCVLPAGARLIQITEGSMFLKVQVENVSALNTVWSLYRDGTLKARLQALLVTDEMRELAGGEQVEVIVTIDEQEYEKARNDLTEKAQEGPDGQEDEQLKYLHQDKLSYIQSYLQKAEDTFSITTETSDSGMPGSHGAPSEFGMEETSSEIKYLTSKLCLKDVSKEVTTELAWRLQSDQSVLQRFYKSYGLDPNKFRQDELTEIRKFFPDTPVKGLKDVFEALQLYDLAELLEKVKPRKLRPALSLKEIEKLPNVSNRPTKVYNKAEVLIIDGTTRAERIGSFFKAFNSQSKLTTLVPLTAFAVDLVEEMETLRESKSKWWKERKSKIEKQIKQKEEELQEENKKFEMAVSTVMDKWIQHAQDEGEESTLFVVLFVTEMDHWNEQLIRMIGRCLKEKFAFIPNTKLVITVGTMISWRGNLKLPRETLHVYSNLRTGIVLATMLELLEKRRQTLDLISVMMELQRTVAIKLSPQSKYSGLTYFTREAVKVQENLSCLPRLQKTEEI